jgi:hypothetical protein
MVEEATRTFGHADIVVNNAQSWGRPGKTAGGAGCVPARHDSHRNVRREL